MTLDPWPASANVKLDQAKDSKHFFFKKKKFLLLTLLLLPGCSSLLTQSAGAGVAAAGVSNALTTNSAVTAGIGLGAQAGITALQKYLSRRLHQGEQDNIAAAVAKLRPGQEAAWKIAYRIPIANEHGDVTVTRIIKTPLTICKEVAFTVIDGNAPSSPRGLYITSACAQPDGTWKWAQAEPATARWGFLQ
jgi:surface antigen